MTWSLLALLSLMSGVSIGVGVEGYIPTPVAKTCSKAMAALMVWACFALAILAVFSDRTIGR